MKADHSNKSPQKRLIRELLGKVCYYKLQKNFMPPPPKASKMIEYLVEKKGMTKKEAKFADWAKYINEVGR